MVQVSSMNHNMQLLLDSLQDGIVIVSPKDEVIYANAAVQAIVPIPVGKPLAVASMQGQINSIRQGYLTPPVTYEIDLEAIPGRPERIRVTLLSSPRAREIILVVQKVTAEKMYENAISNLAEMIDSSCCTPMENFLAAAASMLENVSDLHGAKWKLQEEVGKVTRMGRELEGLLRNIVLLASAYKSTSMLCEERILVSSLMADVAQASAGFLSERRIGLSYCGVSDDLPVIYASRNFLVQALAGYLHYLGEQLDNGEHILISTKAKRDRIDLTIANFAGIKPHSSELLLPLKKGPGNLRVPEEMRLSLPICKRVIELHGGTIQLTEEGGKVGAIVFELPIGAPAKNVDGMGMAQARRYAEDLSALMRRQANASLD